MPLPIPNLDDRDFKMLVDSAVAQIKSNLNSDWKDLSPGDPGMVLLEAFAYLTDQMIYRLNRLPRKIYIAFLRMMGVTIAPPTAASVELLIWHNGPGQDDYLLPAGSKISTGENSSREDRPIFTTLTDVLVSSQSQTRESAARVEAYHCERFEELLGVGKDEPGQTFKVRWAPLLAPTGEAYLDLAVGIQIPKEEALSSDWKGQDGDYYRIWKEVDNFYDLLDTDEVYTVDRQAGIICFAPAARLTGEPMDGPAGLKGDTQVVRPLAAVPPANRKIRAWYANGGGEAGNVPKEKLTALLTAANGSQAPVLNITNPRPATGGFDTETLENALVRGPQQIFSQSRAVTAREFELAALRTHAVARARALAAADLWEHAQPGVVDVILVPRLTSTQDISNRSLRRNEQARSLKQVREDLSRRSPLGIRTNPRWARYKKVWVKAQITPDSTISTINFEQQIADHLRRLISPLAVETNPESGKPAHPGWRFGRGLRVADVYNAILEAANSKVVITALDLMVEHSPKQDVNSLAADFKQEQTWYAASTTQLFRSTNNGAGWELILHCTRGAPIPIQRYLPDGDGAAWQPRKFQRRETIRHVRPNPGRAGQVLATSQYDEGGKPQSPLYFSTDCGESWYDLGIFQDGEIEDAAWLQNGLQHSILLATSQGLFQIDLSMSEDGKPGNINIRPIPVLSQQFSEKQSIDKQSMDKQPDHVSHPVYAVCVIRSDTGIQRVAVALKSRRGVFISDGSDLAPLETPDKTKDSTRFSLLGLSGEDVRHLSVQKLGKHSYLWAGTMALADIGQGCYRWPLEPNTLRNLDDGIWVSQNWNGGSCLALAFDETHVFAVSAWGGILRTEVNQNRQDDIPIWRSYPQADLPRRRTETEDAQGRRGLFETITTIAINRRTNSGLPAVVMIGGPGGIYASPSLERDLHFQKISRNAYSNLKDTVTIPPDWLLVSGPHLIRVSSGSSDGSHPSDAR